MFFLEKILKNGFLALFSLIITLLVLAGGVFFYIYLQLPDVSSLKDNQLEVPLRVYTLDGKLIGEYGEDHRIPVALNQVPKKLIQAVLATEDQRYFDHPGVDFFGLMRASREVLLTGRPTQGASTITMQVARNFFLTRQKTMGRKVKEIMLALKIDSTLSKEKVLELYLNKIYLGQRAYGVEAAAQVYYGKSLRELTLPEIALLAGLPQAPSRDNPIENPHAALERRNHVLERMLNNGYISESQYQKAVVVPVTAHLHSRKDGIGAPYVGEMVRAAMVEAYGGAAYKSGLKVYTTVDSQAQIAANQALKNGLLNYDRRHGFRGPEKHIKKSSQWLTKLQELSPINGMMPAVVTHAESQSIHVLLRDGRKVKASKGYWKRAHLRTGDIIRVEQKEDGWELTQVPKAESALVSIDPQSGAIIALTGGFSFGASSYNRATQARRQPGSSFKPFIYSAALEKGFNLASIINDAPLEQYIPGTNKIWRPQNANQKFYGPTRMRMGLVYSRNLVAIRILKAIGVPYAIDYAQRFGFNSKELPANLTLALGTGSVTPMQLASAYATFANGGYRVKPYFIHHITDDNNNIIYQGEGASLQRIITAENAFLMNSALQDVIQKGTGRRALALNRHDIAGKTGTTNQQMDGWFAGYNGDNVTAVWIGYDHLQSLGENGGIVALPIWIDYMRAVLATKPEHTLSQPPNIVRLPLDPSSGQILNEDTPYAFYEYFDKATLNSGNQPAIDEGELANDADGINQDLLNSSEEEGIMPSGRQSRPSSEKHQSIGEYLSSKIEALKSRLHPNDDGSDSQNEEPIHKPLPSKEEELPLPSPTQTNISENANESLPNKEKEIEREIAEESKKLNIQSHSEEDATVDAVEGQDVTGLQSD